MEIKMKRDSSIICLRVIAFAMIIFSHICHIINLVSLSSFLFGVPLFLLISGYLYGNRELKDYKKFFLGRWEKIIIPVWIYELFVFVYSSIVLKNYPGIKDIILQVLNLQGLQNIFFRSDIYPFASCEILWFTTVIMFCYFLVPFLQFTERKKINKAYLFVVAFILMCALAFVGVRISYFLVFAIGYYLAKIIKKNGAKKPTILFFVIALIFGVLRLFIRKYIDGTILYDEIIVPISFDGMAFFFFSFVIYLYECKESLFDKIAENKIISWFDKISFYVYMTHYLFYQGFWDVRNMTDNIILQVVILLILSFLLAVPFKFICDKILSLDLMKKLRSSKI